jgi:hypothetical protein
LKRLLTAFLFLCISGFCPFVPAQRQDNEFTLEQVMSAPFPSHLVAAPVGGSVAWIQISRAVQKPSDTRREALR